MGRRIPLQSRSIFPIAMYSRLFSSIPATAEQACLTAISWLWPSSAPNCRLVVGGNHLSSDVSTLRMIGADSRAASTDGCDQTSRYSI